MRVDKKISSIYSEILSAKTQNQKLLAVLLDPDKVDLNAIETLVEKIKEAPITHVFVGGSIVTEDCVDALILKLKMFCDLPIILFPGHPSQISRFADGILFLNLISGRNPDYLIDHQVNSVKVLKNTDLEIISTGYILIDGGKETAVQRVSKTQPLSQTNIEAISDTAIAGNWMGNRLIYLEAGSGALVRVDDDIIKHVSKNIHVPLIVGGGIKSGKEIQQAFANGADIVVIGTAFENDINFFDSI